MITLDDAQMMRMVEQPGLLAALASAFRGASTTPPRLHYPLPGEGGAQLLVMPSWSEREAIGVKVITVMPANASRGLPTVDGSYVLLDGQAGSPLAAFSARSLTALRTAGVCALATSVMSRRDAKVLLMIGTGNLVPFLIAAYRAVRSFERVLVWGRTAEKASALAEKLSRDGLQVEAAADLGAALRDADVISCATLANEPLVSGALVRPGTHVDLVGSYTPKMREGDTDLFRRARVVVDTATAFDESGDVMVPLQEGAITREVPDLSALLSTPSLGRTSDQDVTVFKSVGTGLADLATARYLLGRHRSLR
ncbi:MAG: ornithine cyclodeaminase family protein [Proteobacteria bacterium]|nr:ornithine cyclodeaminase family protein [Pseudomonadota bacterium]